MKSLLIFCVLLIIIDFGANLDVATCSIKIKFRACDGKNENLCPKNYECINNVTCCPIAIKRLGKYITRATYLTTQKCDKHVALDYISGGEFCSLAGFVGHLGEYDFFGQPVIISNQRCAATEDCDKDHLNPGVCVNEHEKNRTCYHDPSRKIVKLPESWSIHIWLFFGALSTFFRFLHFFDVFGRENLV
ncbi:unnamed protein product [Caenorhabditis angaria]|uniref:Domain of unknown function DX domain-containing protein n=1 Tax=Caenorhabditis angaria TaxID=860376 RepID=A0A9P1IJH9_9PELO|nr:unnamed protein product [Caenorhabditis angaria]